MSVLFPAFQANFALSRDVWILFGGIYFFIFSLAIIFDIRDVEIDETEKRTVPQLFGKKGAAFIAIMFTIFSAVCLIYLRTELLFPFLSFVAVTSILFYIATKI